MFRRVLLGLTLTATMMAAAQGDAFAQRLRWDFGLKGGVSWATLYGTDADSVGTDFRTGAAGGVWVTVLLNENVGIRVEGIYAQKGSKNQVDDVDITAQLDYIDIPVLVMFIREYEEMARFNMAVGPVFSFKTKAEAKGVQGGEFVGFDLDDLTKSFDFGGAINIGGALNVGRADITLDLRYTVSFISIDDTGNDLDIRNNNLTLMAGIGVPIGYR